MLCVWIGSLAYSQSGAVRSEIPAPRAPKVIVLGIDGLDTRLVEQWMATGDLPNLSRLARTGTYTPMETTNPAQSPVSWTCLLTGANPGKTNLFDFVRRLLPANDYGPLPCPAGVSKEVASFAEVDADIRDRLSASLDPDALPDSIFVYGSEIEAPFFWHELGESDIRFVGLRVPCAFPVAPAPNTRILAGLFTPDVAGGYGSWFVFTNDEWALNEWDVGSGGTMFKLYRHEDGAFRNEIPGPFDFVTEQRRVKAPLTLWPDFSARRVRIELGGQVHEVEEGTWSPWFRFRFKVGELPLPVLVRFHVDQCHLGPSDEPLLRLYVPPLGHAPEVNTALMPLASPPGFAAELVADVGLFSTLGWGAPTNAYKEGEVDAQTFVSGVELTFREDVRLLERELSRDDWDCLLATFQLADHAGHLLFRFIDPGHPRFDELDGSGRRLREQVITAFGQTFPGEDALRLIYREIDRLVGSVLDRLEAGEFGKGATLLVLSDHGMRSFRRGAAINVWLEQAGYMAVNEPSGSLLRNVEWPGTRAYSMGLGKIYLNLEGREPQGIVPAAEYDALCSAIIEDLEAWTDPQTGARVVHRAYKARDLYSGPYADTDADIVIGLAPPYRVDWQSAGGGFDERAVDSGGLVENDHAWTGDHVSVDPSFVPGLLFSNRKMAEERAPTILDIAPTILALFGVDVPPHYDGAALTFEAE